MFPTLFAVVVALVLGHMAPALAVAVRDHGWFRALLAWLGARFGDDGFWRGHWGLALALVPVLLAVAALQWLLDDGIAFGLPALVFGVVAVFYAWGPRDLDLDVQAAVDAIDAADAGARDAALARLRPATATGADGGAVGDVFVAALRRWFGVLFWFVVLGAAGAIAYRLVSVAAEDAMDGRLPSGQLAGARRLQAVLDWPVAQLMALTLALVGNFDVAVAAWKDAGGAAWRAGAGMLAVVGRATVRRELAGFDADAPVALPVGDAGLARALGDAMSLVWRVLLAWLAVLALFVVAGWVN